MRRSWHTGRQHRIGSAASGATRGWAAPRRPQARVGAAQLRVAPLAADPIRCCRPVCQDRRMRVALDATPLIGSRTGVGRYVAGLVPALTALADPPEVVLTAFTVRGAGDIEHFPGTTTSARRFPARVLQACWGRWSLPPVEWLSGRADVFHATNFVLPPARRAAGVVMVHDLSFVRHPDTVSAASLRYRDLVPRSVRRAEVVVTPTETTAAEVADYYGLHPERVLPTPLGVDPAWATATAPDAHWLGQRGLPERYLLFVGSREPRKNLPVLLRAHAALRASRPDVPPLVLAGPPGWWPAPPVWRSRPDTRVSDCRHSAGQR